LAGAVGIIFLASLGEKSVVVINQSLCNGSSKSFEEDHSVDGILLKHLIQFVFVDLDRFGGNHTLPIGGITLPINHARPAENLSLPTEGVIDFRFGFHGQVDPSLDKNVKVLGRIFCGVQLSTFWLEFLDHDLRDLVHGILAKTSEKFCFLDNHGFSFLLEGSKRI